MTAGGLRRDLNVIVKETVSQATEVAAREFQQASREAAGARGQCTVALAGGTTPYVLYQRLARNLDTSQTPWDRMVVFFGDERDVSLDNVESNYCMARRTLLDHVPIPPTQVYAMRGDAEDLDASSAEYERLIRQLVPAERGGVPRFDLILLGMGADGHTASLFPGTPGMEEAGRLVTACFVPVLGRKRMTFTFPLINAARNILMVVTGEDKADVVARLLGDDEQARQSVPASRLHTRDGRITLVLDAAAARLTQHGPA